MVPQTDNEFPVIACIFNLHGLILYVSMLFISSMKVCLIKVQEEPVSINASAIVLNTLILMIG